VSALALPSAGGVEGELALALEAHRAGLLVEAVERYRALARTLPRSARVRTNLGAALRSLGQCDEAVAWCREAVALEPDLADAHHNLGNALAAGGDFAGAVAAFARALELIPGDPVTRAALLTARAALEDAAARAGDRPDPDLVCYAFYDLSVSPVTFDFLSFLLLADLHRRKNGLYYLHVVIVPGNLNGFRMGDEWAYDSEHQFWRLKNVVVPLCWLMPNTQVTVSGSREEAALIFGRMVHPCFPPTYSPSAPVESHHPARFIAAFRENEFHGITVSADALRYAGQWIASHAKGRKVVAITLREAPYEKDRNSNLDAWTAFAKRLDPNVFFPVFIRDVDAAFSGTGERLLGLPVFCEATWNMELRAAIHELAYLNLSVNNGPGLVAWGNRRARALVFKIVTPSAGATTVQFCNAIGWPPGSQLEFLTPFQRFVWEDDSLAVIEREFSMMCERIGGQSNADTQRAE
jgi:tetratricopeptide (TPR) repeat protein